MGKIRIERIENLKDHIKESNHAHRKSKVRIKSKLNQAIKEESRNYRKEHKAWFITFDIIIGLLILLNLGALLITNALVMKTTVEAGEPIKFMEANPGASEIHGFEMHPEATGIMASLIIFLLLWAFITFYYIYRRNRVYSDAGLNGIIFFIIFYALAMTTDFVNDFGYIVGIKLFS